MVNLNVIVLLITEGNFANVQKLYNDISKAELQDFDIIVLDQVNSNNDLPTITFNKHDIPDKFVTNMLSPKGAWDYFPIWAHENKYEYYWVIENLVHYSGDWAEFIQKYVSVECDLLTNGRGLHNSKWPWWKRQRNIYGRNEIEYPARNSKLYQTAFLPCSRFSRKLVEKGYKHLENNQKAFIEIFWSTICVKERLSVMNWNSEDIGEVTWKPKGEYTNVTKKGKLWYPVNKVENMNVNLNKQVVEFKKKVGIIYCGISYATNVDSTHKSNNIVNWNYFSKSFENICEFAGGRKNIDIFLATNNHKYLNDLIEFYNPVAYSLDDFNDEFDLYPQFHDENIMKYKNRNFRFFNGLNMINTHINNTCITYDYIIVSRFDIYLLFDLKKQNIIPNNLYLISILEKEFLIDDNFYIFSVFILKSILRYQHEFKKTQSHHWKYLLNNISPIKYINNECKQVPLLSSYTLQSPDKSKFKTQHN